MYLYGIHPCKAAILNPKRMVEKIYVTDRKLLDKLFENAPLNVNGNAAGDHKDNRRDNKKQKIEVVDKKQLESFLPRDAVHQGVALKVHPLPFFDISDLRTYSNSQTGNMVVILDQVSDPHNVGAVLRTAAVFGAKALIMPERNATKETGVLAKSACGALEIVPLCLVKNLAQAIQDLKDMNFWCVGFAEGADKPLSAIDLKGNIALVMGSEGDGMRQRTQSLCDFNVYLPSATDFSTLNVSNAAAIAMYEVFKAN